MKEQRRFKSAEDCVNEAFVLKVLGRKYREKRKELCVALIDLERCMIKHIERNYGEYFMSMELKNSWLGCEDSI